MNIFEALAILESAVLECKKRNVNTPEATEALDLLAPYVRQKLVVAQFRHHIARERDNDHEKEGQRQVLRATFPWIRNSVKELIATEMDELARDFPDMHDMEVKNAIEYLAREYDRLGEPWVFNSAPTETQQLWLNQSVSPNSCPKLTITNTEPSLLICLYGARPS
jgi:hypothetical protein